MVDVMTVPEALLRTNSPAAVVIRYALGPLLSPLSISQAYRPPQIANHFQTI